ncbi:uncharacterized protein LOC113236022 [Hyposmocoma kahamanoa]|uniref:uncharacterized protein LOC113236022 n=1 Tax=Hyposmocoma kahamanoa TaxID=1477025 RepID=UPI000E6D8D03|nr:uncharacterized protein LOC113236022 [Hyposmocoma kahamanoa]
MMPSPVLLLLLSLSAALAAPPIQYDDYSVVMPQKRAALVLDRLLVALQKALHDVPSAPEPRYDRIDRDGPRAVPLRLAPLDYSDTMLSDLPKGGSLRRRASLDEAPPFSSIEEDDDLNTLQRRGGEGRGRVVKCYFNAITCF